MPRLTLAGVLGGLLAGLGFVVLLQQFGVTPLTSTMAIAGMVGGIVLGILIPSLINVWSVMNVNRAIARGEQRLGAALARGGSPPQEPQP